MTFTTAAAGKIALSSATLARRAETVKDFPILDCGFRIMDCRSLIAIGTRTPRETSRRGHKECAWENHPDTSADCNRSQEPETA